MARTLFVGRWAFHVGMQVRLPPAHRTPVDKPWLGFAYGSWWPRCRVNWPGGKYLPGTGGYWLCFHWSIDVWPKHAEVRGIHLL